MIVKTSFHIYFERITSIFTLILSTRELKIFFSSFRSESIDSEGANSGAEQRGRNSYGEIYGRRVISLVSWFDRRPEIKRESRYKRAMQNARCTSLPAVCTALVQCGPRCKTMRRLSIRPPLKKGTLHRERERERVCAACRHGYGHLRHYINMRSRLERCPAPTFCLPRVPPGGKEKKKRKESCEVVVPCRGMANVAPAASKEENLD